MAICKIKIDNIENFGLNFVPNYTPFAQCLSKTPVKGYPITAPIKLNAQKI
jgi:hypothetical protein